MKLLRVPLSIFLCSSIAAAESTPYIIGGTDNALIGNVGDRLKTDASITAQIDSTPATQNITAQDTTSVTAAGANSQVFVLGTPTAGSTASFAFGASSWKSAEILVTGIWTGSLVAEVSMNGTIWTPRGVKQAGLAQISTSFTNGFQGGMNVSAMQFLRVRSTGAWTGTATVLVTFSQSESNVIVTNPLLLKDATTQTIFNSIKAASTAPLATDPALVVGLSPNGNQATATNQTAEIVSLTSIDAKLNSLGQKASAASVPVVLANDQSAIQTAQNDTTGSGTFTTAGASCVATNCVQITLGQGQAEWALQLFGTFSAGSTVNFEGSLNGTNWVGLNGRLTGTVNTALANFTTGPGPLLYRGNLAGMNFFRARCSVVAGGDSISVQVRSGTGTGAVFLNASIPAGSNNIGTVITNGLYNVTTNPLPSSTSPIMHTRASSQALTDAVMFQTGIQAPSPDTGVYAADVAIRNYDGSRIATATPLAVQVGDGTDTAEVNSGSADGQAGAQNGVVGNARCYVYSGNWDRCETPGQAGNNQTATNLAAISVGAYGLYSATLPTMTDGRFGNIPIDSRSRQIVAPDLRLDAGDNRTYFTAAFDAITATTTLFTPTAGKVGYLENFSITCYNGSLLAAGLAKLRDNTTVMSSYPTPIGVVGLVAPSMTQSNHFGNLPLQFVTNINVQIAAGAMTCGGFVSGYQQ